MTCVPSYSKFLFYQKMESYRGLTPRVNIQAPVKIGCLLPMSNKILHRSIDFDRVGTITVSSTTSIKECNKSPSRSAEHRRAFCPTLGSKITPPSSTSQKSSQSGRSKSQAFNNDAPIIETMWYTMFAIRCRKNLRVYEDAELQC